LPSSIYYVIMIVGDFMRIYEFFTQWITLGICFFIIDYNTEWLQVVTLGGLVAGSLLIGLWATLLDRMGGSCAVALGGHNEPKTLYHKKNTSLLPELSHKAIVLLGVLLGVYGLALTMPGYSLEVTGQLVTFLFAYGFFAIFLGKLLKKTIS